MTMREKIELHDEHGFETIARTSSVREGPVDDAFEEWISLLQVGQDPCCIRVIVDVRRIYSVKKIRQK